MRLGRKGNLEGTDQRRRWVSQKKGFHGRERRSGFKGIGKGYYQEARIKIRRGRKYEKIKIP